MGEANGSSKGYDQEYDYRDMMLSPSTSIHTSPSTHGKFSGVMASTIQSCNVIIYSENEHLRNDFMICTVDLFMFTCRILVFLYWCFVPFLFVARERAGLFVI